MADEHQRWLEAFVERHHGVAGTVHIAESVEAAESDLVMTASMNIPPPLQAIVSRVVYGKGMAGAAQLKRESVQTCNLQTDDDGPFNPAARQAGGAAAIAIPLVSKDYVRAVVGVTFDHEGEIAGAELVALETDATSLPPYR